MKKLEDIIVYRDCSFYCAFPSVVCLPDGELIASSYAWAPIDRNITDADFSGFTVLRQSVVLGESPTPPTKWRFPLDSCNLYNYYG